MERVTLKDQEPAPFSLVDASPALVFYDGAICMAERCVRTGQVRYFDVTAQVAAALRAKGGGNGDA